MQEIIANINDLWIPLVVCWGLFILFTLWRPQRFRNSLFLMASILVTLLFVSGLFGKYSGQALGVVAVLFILAVLFVPVMLIINGITMRKRESRSVGNMLSLILGILIAVGEIALLIEAFVAIDAWKASFLRGPSNFIGFTILYFSVWILAFVLYVLSIQVMPHARNFDYIIIHGCGLIDGSSMSRLLSNRLDKAIELYYKCDCKPYLIPSGGKGPDEDIPEAEAMTKYLLERGIPADKIIPEAESMTTRENIKNSMEIIMGREGKHKTALVSSNYHVYRCMLYAAKMKFKCRGIGAAVAWYYWPSAVLREFAAIFTRLPHVVWIILGYVVFIIIPGLWLMYN